MYLLNDKKEHLRLDKQNSNELYSVKNELNEIIFNQSDHVLDAGCGSGAITEELLNLKNVNIIGVDGSQERIKQYQNKFSEFSFIEGVVSNLDFLPFKNETFSKVICRFVLHHQKDPFPIIQELYRVLKKDGELILIDSDGIFFNLFNHKFSFEKEFSLLREKLPLDLYVGRKLKSYCQKAGLRNLKSRIIPMHFTGNNKSAEVEQYRERFDSLLPIFQEILGKTKGQNFISKYIFALEEDHTELFYNKFITRGIK